MAISRLSSPVENWVEIGTSSPTSGSVVTFSSIANYRKLRVVAFKLTYSTTATVKMTFNGDTGNNYASRPDEANNYLAFGSGSATSFDVDILFNSQTTFKRIEGWEYEYTYPYQGLWTNTAAITSIDLTLSTGTYSAGTVKLYGTN